MVGHYPVEVDNSGAVPRFSLILEGDGGRLFRKTYTFEGYRVRMVDKEPCQAPSQVVAQPHAPPVQSPKERPWYIRMKDSVRRLFP